MYVLGIEAATPVASVAVAGLQGILAERMVRNQRTHSVNLLPMIKAVLAEAEVSRGSLTGIAVSNGPGSFTGLRIGLSVAKTLAQVWDLPVTGISTLAGLAHGLTGHSRLVCPLLNARKSEVYTAVYDWSNAAGVLLAPPRAARLEDLIELFLGWQRPVTFLGDGAPVYAAQLQAGLGKLAAFAPAALNYPRGGVIAQLGLAALEKDEGSSPLALLPEYIRLAEAEVLWRKRQGAGG